MVRSVRRLERVLPIWDESILLMTLYTCGIALHAASMRSCSSGAAAVGAVGSASVNIDILCLRMCVFVQTCHTVEWQATRPTVGQRWWHMCHQFGGDYGFCWLAGV